MPKNPSDLEAGRISRVQPTNRKSWSDIAWRWSKGLAVLGTALVGGATLFVASKKIINKNSGSSKDLIALDNSERKLFEITAITKPSAKIEDKLFVNDSLLVPISDEFIVNNFTEYSQTQPAVTRLMNGVIVVTWSSAYQDGTANSIYAKKLTDRGKDIGEEFKISDKTTDSQVNSVVTGLANGNYAVAWEDSAGKLYSRRLTPDGNKLGIEAVFGSVGDFGCGKPDIISYSDNSYLVVWQPKECSGEGGVLGQYFNSAGGLDGNVVTFSGGGSPAATVFPDDSYIVIWKTVTPSSSIAVQYFNPGRSKKGNEIYVKHENDQYHFWPACATLTSQNVVIVFVPSIDRQPWYKFNIFFQILSSSGDKISNVIQANVYYSPGVTSPAVVGLSNGNFVIAWIGVSYNIGIRVRYFESNGNPLTDDIQLSQDASGTQIYPIRMLALDDGQFFVAWPKCLDNTGSDYNIKGRFFSVEGVRPDLITNNFNINGDGLHELQTIITASQVYYNDPDGPNAELNIKITDKLYCWFTLNGFETENFYQRNVTDNLVKVHTNSNNLPQFKIQGCDVDDRCTSIVDAVVNYNNPDHPPEVVPGKEIADIQAFVGQIFELDVTGTFYDADGDTLKYILELASKKPLPPWIVLEIRIQKQDGDKNIQSEKIFIVGTPAPGAVTDTYLLEGVEQTRVKEANETVQTPFRIVLDSPTSNTGTSDGAPAWKVILPAVMTPVGLTGTLILCTSSACLTLGGGTLCFVGRQQYSEQKAKITSRKDDYLAYLIFKAIGAPYDSADFRNDKGREFCSAIRSILREANIEEPSLKDMQATKNLANNLAKAIKQVIRKKGYHHYIRKFIGFHFSLFLCGCFQPGSTASYLEKNKETIVAELNKLIGNRELKTLQEKNGGSTSMTASLLANAADSSEENSVDRNNVSTRQPGFIIVTDPKVFEKMAEGGYFGMNKAQQLGSSSSFFDLPRGRHDSILEINPNEPPPAYGETIKPH